MALLRRAAVTGLFAGAAAAMVITRPPCTNVALAESALELATGPSPGGPQVDFPTCAPSLRQDLGHEAEATVARALGMAQVPTAAMSQAPEVAQEPHLLHLYVVQSDTDWCRSPCEGPTWELAAPKPEVGSPYELLEAAIWRQDRRVALYRFDSAWLGTAKRSFQDLCHGAGWACPKYRQWREARRILEVGPWPAELDNDPPGLSNFLRAAFEQVLAQAHAQSPGAKHVAVTYSGHGSHADGALFEGSVMKEDAVGLLNHVADMSADSWGRLSLLNFGGNCAEGRWNMLAAMHPFADWMLASDLNVGGFELTKAEKGHESMQRLQRLGDLAVLKRSSEATGSVDEMVNSIVQARQEIWASVFNESIKRQGLEQSIAAFRPASEFSPFAEAFRKAYVALHSPEARASFLKHAEANRCDVLESARWLDAELQRQGVSSAVVVQFEALRPLYASTRDVVEWKSKTNGLGFNFLGFKDVPCDFPSALGPDVVPPPGGWPLKASQWQPPAPQGS
mmetsp:Transcript_43364/g.139351  ORF Transcript_43364/g.139351 Transcript_43364/m.139351 type:complete len:509 (+) Transcript_43364:71-1597(+)